MRRWALSGSSASAALTAGSLKTKHPALDGATIERHLIATGDPLSTTGPLGGIKCDEGLEDCRGTRLNIETHSVATRPPLRHQLSQTQMVSLSPQPILAVQLTWTYNEASTAGLLDSISSCIRSHEKEMQTNLWSNNRRRISENAQPRRTSGWRAGYRAHSSPKRNRSLERVGREQCTRTHR